MKHSSLLFICLILFFGLVQSQTNKKKQDAHYFTTYINNSPAFSMFGDNYFITGTSLQDGISSQTSDAKFLLGLKQRLTNKRLPWNTFAFFTYRQKSFWNIYKESFPFRETNYNPSLGLAKPFLGPNGITDGLWFSFEHESNGRDGNNSRSWNYFSLQYIKFHGEHWQYRAKVWAPIGDMTDNEDIIDYRGLFEIGASYRPLPQLFIDADFRQAFFNRLRGSIKIGLSYKIAKNSNQYLYLQYFGGYSEDLIQYNQDVSNLRIGIAFKDLFGNFKN